MPIGVSKYGGLICLDQDALGLIEHASMGSFCIKPESFVFLWFALSWMPSIMIISGMSVPLASDLGYHHIKECQFNPGPYMY